MKLFAGIICALLLSFLGTTEEAKAIYLTNNTAIALTMRVQTTCGIMGPYVVPPLTTIYVNPPPGCTATGIFFRGVFYPYSPGFVPIPPPNPPNSVWVTPNGAIFN